VPPSADVDINHVAPHGDTAEPASEPAVIVDIALPRTVAEAKAQSTQHTLYRHKKLKDDFAFSHWCVLVPHPGSGVPGGDDDDVSAAGSAVVFSQRHVLGGALPDSALLVAFVTSGGEPDTGLAGDIARALAYEDDLTPLLVFTSSPRLRIYRRYPNVELLAVKSRRVDGIVVPMGGVSRTSLRKIVKAIPGSFTEGSLDVQALEAAIATSRASTTRSQALKRVKKAGPLVSVLTTIGKAVFGGG
jgi:hypothetical protein